MLVGGAGVAAVGAGVAVCGAGVAAETIVLAFVVTRSFFATDIGLWLRTGLSVTGSPRSTFMQTL